MLTRLFDDGKSSTEMGDALGITAKMARYYVRRLGLLRLKPKVDIELAARMFAAGATYRDIAKTLRLPMVKRGCAETIVIRALKRHGLWKPRRNTTFIDLELLARLFHEGKIQDEIVKSLGISRHIVRVRLKRLGLWRGAGRGRRHSKIDRELAARMFAAGQSYRQIAKFFGVTSQAIPYALKQQGCWQPRRNR